MITRPATPLRSAALCALALALALTLAACSRDEPAPPRDAAAEPSREEIEQGEHVFADSGCPACHGDAGEGVEGVGPPLESIATYWDAERLASYIRNPEAYRAEHPEFESRRDVEYGMEMPPSGHLSAEELRALSSWLLTR